MITLLMRKEEPNSFNKRKTKGNDNGFLSPVKQFKNTGSLLTNTETNSKNPQVNCLVREDWSISNYYRLQEAVKNCDMEIALLEHVLSDDVTKSTILHLAVKLNQEKAVKDYITKHRGLIKIKNAKGETPLHIAASTGNKNICQMLLDRQASPDELNCIGDSPLHVAVCKQEPEIVEMLLKSGANVNLQNGKGNTPLHLTVKFGVTFSVTKLLIDHGANFYVENNKSKTPADITSHVGGNTLLHVLAEHNCYEKAKILLNNGAGMDLKNFYGNTPLMLALYNNSTLTAELLILNGANVNTINKKKDLPLHLSLNMFEDKQRISHLLLSQGACVNTVDRKKNTPLHYASMFNVKSVVEVILRSSKLDLQNRKGDTPLHLCAKEGFYSIAELLLKANANVNIKNRKGDTPLLITANKGNVKFTAELLKSGADVDEKNQNGDTPLHLCAEEGFNSIAELLLKANAKVNIKNIKGDTPLHITAYKGNVKFTAMLLESGADVDEKNKNGDTPLHIAIEKNYSGQIAKLLDEKGASWNVQNSKLLTPVNVLIDKKSVESNYAPLIEKLLKDEKLKYVHLQNESKNTLLHTASMNGFLGVVQTLLEQGAHINSQNKNGDTPLILAFNQNHQEIVKTLIQRGANVNLTNSKKSSLLHLSISRCRFDQSMIYLLLSNGANVNVADGYGNTALHHCVMQKAVSVLNVILNKDISLNLNVQNKRGDTPLHLCAKGMLSLLEIGEILIEKNADVNIKNKNGDTPLHVVHLNSNSKLAKRLLEAGANIDATNILGDTALHKAARHKGISQPRLKLIDYLIESGAKVDIKNLNNKTVYQESHLAPVRCRLAKHILKLKAANLEVNDSVTNLDRYLLEPGFEENCLNELERIKSTKICSDSNLDIVFSHYKKPYYLKDNGRRKSLEEILRSPILCEEFPLFGSILINTFKNTKHRALLVTTAQQGLDILFSQLKTATSLQGWQGNLPDLVKEIIMAYFNNEDLQNLIKAAELLIE